MNPVKFIAILALAFAVPAFPQENETHPSQEKAGDRTIASRTAPIQDNNQLRQYLATHGRADDGHSLDPLSYLSRESRSAFILSLTFGSSGGLASFNYGLLEEELTATQAYQILALFGEQRLAATLSRLRVETTLDRDIMNSVELRHHGDYHDYWCSSPATCSQRLQSICIHDNC